jgi:FkbM family methyltransferase
MRFNTNNLIVNIDKNLELYFPQNLRARLLNNTWEKAEISMIKYIPKNSVVLELGGCIGVFSGCLNKHISDPKKHLVLEANLDFLTVLKGVKEDNNLSYTAISAILGCHNGQENFYKHPKYSLSGCSKKHANFYIECSVEKYTLSYLETTYSMCFDTICMDIEGGEYTLYQDNFFSDKHIQNIKYLLIEMHGDRFATQDIEGNNLAQTLHNHLCTMFVLKHKTEQSYLYERKL